MGEKRPRGRPSAFTQETADEICERLAKGEPLAAICRDEHMPAYRTVYDWQEAHADFSAKIAHARVDGYDTLAAECLEIADDKSRDVRFVGGDGDEREVCNTEFVQRAKLRIETRLKLLAKWDPKRYGERQTVEHTDPSGGNPFASLMEAVAANGRPRPQTGD